MLDGDLIGKMMPDGRIAYPAGMDYDTAQAAYESDMEELGEGCGPRYYYDSVREDTPYDDGPRIWQPTSALEY